MSGAPSQLETFDYKPKLKELHDKDLPESVRKGQRLTTMTSGQKRIAIAQPQCEFRQPRRPGRVGQRDLLPHTAKSMHTEAINHDPAITFIQTGSQHRRPAQHRLLALLRPRLRERDLPSSSCCISKAPGDPDDQPLYDRLWGAASCPPSTRA
jgi:hypothetical protein